MDNIEIHLVRQTRGGKEEGEEHRSTKVYRNCPLTAGEAAKITMFWQKIHFSHREAFR